MSGDLPPDPFPDDPFPDDSRAAHPAGGPGAGRGDPSDVFSGMGVFGAMLGDLGKQLSSQLAGQGAVSWDAARQGALLSATQGEAERNVDPIDRIRLEELCRLAERHLYEITDLRPPVEPVAVRAVTRSQWAMQFLDDERDLLTKLGGLITGTINAAVGESGNPAGDGGGSGSFGGVDRADGAEGAGALDAFETMLTGLFKMMSPMLSGLQAGALAGQLAQRCMGSYDLPLPRPAAHQICFVPQNIAAFANEWSLPLDTVRMRVCIVELASNLVLGAPPIRERLNDLLGRYASSYRLDSSKLDEHFAGIDLSDPASMQRFFGDPSALLAAAETDEQHRLRREIDAVMAAVLGVVDHLVETVTQQLLGPDAAQAEALRRRRAEAGAAGRLTERLLGLGLDQGLRERARSFTSGVLERGGERGLAQLWATSENLPTPAEIDAPGLWLARIGLLD